MESEKVKKIKKGLECCGKNNPDCDNCPYSVSGGSLCRQPEQDALTLINELERENERLLESCKNCHYIKDLKIANGHAKELKDRIAELEKVYDRQVRIINDLNIEIVKEQEKLQKFAERLKEKKIDFYTKGIIDETLKEMLEVLEEKPINEIIVSSADTCIYCGQIVPEGTQVCINCENKILER